MVPTNQSRRARRLISPLAATTTSVRIRPIPWNTGHGFDFIAHDQGFTVYYYGHTADGERLWLISETITTNLVYRQPYDLPMFEVSNGVFGQPEFPASEWGTITITLYDCDNGHADFDGKDGQLSMGLVRLVRLGDSSCE